MACEIPVGRMTCPMRNDFIGADIDGDARAMNGGQRPGCGCQHHDNGCSCRETREGRER